MCHFRNLLTLIVMTSATTTLSQAKNIEVIGLEEMPPLTAVQIKEYIGDQNACYATLMPTNTSKIVAIFSDGRYMQAVLGQPSTFLFLNKKSIAGKPSLLMNHIRSTQLRYLLKIQQYGYPIPCKKPAECTLTHANLELTEQLDIGSNRKSRILSSYPILVTEYCKEKKQKLFYSEKWYQRITKEILHH